MMNLAKSFPDNRGQIVALVGLIVVSLPLAFSLPIPIIITFLLLVFLRLILILVGKKSLATWQNIIITISLAGIAYLNMNVLWGREGGLSILLLFVCMKSFDGGTYRDWQMFLLFCFFLVVGPLLFEQEAFNAIWMVFSLGWILFSFSVLSRAPTKHALKQTLFALLISAPFMIVLFVAIPRLSEPIMQFPQKQNQQSGMLSETMNPGSVSELILSNKQIFNAVFEDGYIPKNNQLYWRVMVMPDFDGKTWQAAPIDLIDYAQPIPANLPIKYHLTLEDQKGRLPALDYPIGLDVETKRGFGSTIAANRSYTQLRRIELQSNGLSSLPENLPLSLRRQYLLLPKGSNPKTQEWARKLAGESHSSEEFIKKVLSYLGNNGFKYTLKPSTLDHTSDQIDEFLFTTKNGFCEHYSSAFAVAMRAGGLPSRVVVGYQGGSFYSEGGFWQIKGKDAHAWTEVWQPETKTWIRVDPTSAVSSDRIDMGIDDALSEEDKDALSDASGSGKSNLWNLLKVNGEFYWQQWVVGFNAEKQQDLFKKLGLEKVNATTILTVLVVGGILAFLPVILWWSRFLRKQGNGLSDGFNLLKKKLFGEENFLYALGPLDILNELKERGQEREYDKVKPIIDTFIQLNYKNKQIDKKAARKWLRLVKRLKL